MMGVAVYNVSSTSAGVSWPRSPTCADTFYSVMYNPDGNSLLTGYKRKRFKHEERIPVSQTTTHLANLLPHTAYFLCVTCQAADPARDQCQMFSTLSDSGERPDGSSWERTVAIWVTCCLSLLIIASVLLWGRRHKFSIPGRAADGRPVLTNPSHHNTSGCAHLSTPRSSSKDSVKRATVIQPCLMLEQGGQRLITQEHQS